MDVGIQLINKTCVDILQARVSMGNIYNEDGSQIHEWMKSRENTLKKLKSINGRSSKD